MLKLFLWLAVIALLAFTIWNIFFREVSPYDRLPPINSEVPIEEQEIPQPTPPLEGKDKG